MLALALVPLLAAGAASSTPDVYFEQSTVLYEDGRAAGPGVVSRVWYAGKRMRLEAAGVVDAPALILRLGEGKAYRVEPDRRRVVALDLDRLRTQAQMDLSVAGDLMGAGEEARVRTAPLPGTRTIAGQACRGFRISGPSAVLELWVAPGLPVGVDAFVDFLEWSGATQSLAGFVQELRKLPGFPLETRSRVSVLGEVQETLSTVTKVTVGPVDPALFEPPAGYRVVPDVEEAP
ncbi:MAG TPA: DUF4412 domain-containing protein [Vicinamibacteria bacterium]|nr:DUF4412 domain-containing protein [Vicinamibacteria bacterium]